MLAYGSTVEGCGYFTVNRTEELRAVDFPTVSYFFLFSKFFVVFWFQEIFSRKKFWEKKRQKILTRKYLERKI